MSQTPTTPPASTPAPASTPPADPNAPEMSTKEAPAIFKARVNLVLVPVIVRDAKGATIGTLSKENFQLFDGSKPQEITKFSVEKSGGKAVHEAQTLDTPPGEGGSVPDIPERFVGYLFDDVHLPWGDLVRARDAAARQIAVMAKTDRAAIYTTSGQGQQDFTDDQDKLHEALMRLRNRSISDTTGASQCPDISYYMADMIANKHDPMATSIGVQEVIICQQLPPGPQATQMATQILGSAAMRMLATGDHETRLALSVLQDVVRRMAALPGQRIVILASPGFLSLDLRPEESAVMDLAVRANVIINTLDARGLWVDPTLDVSQPNRANTQSFLILKQQYDRMAATAQEDILVEMAAGTGGSLFHNNNDLDAGFRQLATAPDYYYVLGFAPQNLKLDGTFHSIKVNLKPGLGSGLTIQARKGFFAPRKLATAEETAKEEVEDAVFSREEMSELPVELHTQFFKASDKEATITVLCRMDPRHMQFRKGDGRNSNILTVVSAVFDRNGNFISGNQKTVDLKLKDETLAKLSAAGTMALKTTFSVPPSTYMVRLVVRDSEGQLMSALSSAVAIQ